VSRTTTLVLAVLLVLGLAVAMFWSTPDAPKSELPASFLSFLPAEVKSLDVRNPHGDLHLERDAADRERWRVRVGKVLVRADSLEVEHFLNDLSRLAPKNLWKKAEVKPEERKSWGLEAPAVAVTLALEGRTVAAAFGNRTVDGKNTYAEKDSDGDAWMVPAAGLEALDSLKPEGLRETTPVGFSKYDARSLEVKRADGLVFAVSKATGATTWEVTAPYRGTADPVRLDELMSRILGVEVVEFAADGAPDLDRYGLVEPRAVVTIRREGRDAPVVLKLGKEAGEGRAYFVEEGEPSVYACGREFPAAVTGLDPAALRDHNLLRVGWTKFQSIEFAHPEKGWKFLRALDHWDLEKPERCAADQDRVADVEKALRELEATKFLEGADPASLGLASREEAAATLVLTGVDEAGNRTLLLGKRNEDGSVPARLLPAKEGGEAPPPVLVDGSFLDLMEEGWLHFRSREVLSFEPSEVRGLSRRTAGGEETYLRDHGGAWKAAPGGKEPDRDALTAAFTHLLKVHCSSYEARTKEGLEAWGLGDPPAVGSVTVIHKKDMEKEEHRTTLVLGKAVENGGAHYARRADGDTVFVLPDTILNGADLVRFHDLLTARWRKAEADPPPPPPPPSPPDEGKKAPEPEGPK
jgi:hypothetical protein